MVLLRILALSLAFSMLACGGSDTAGSSSSSSNDSNTSTNNNTSETTETNGSGTSTGAETATDASTTADTPEAATESDGSTSGPTTEDSQHEATQDDVETGGGEGGEGTVFGTPCSQNEKVGSFRIYHDPDPAYAYAAIDGAVADGVIPLTVLQLAKELGDCKLLRKVNPFCEDGCEGGELCDHNGSCIPYPANMDVGNITVQGLLEDPITLEPKGNKSYFDTQVPYPLFEPNAEINLDAEGNETEAFSLTAYGVPDLEIPQETWLLSDGEPLAINWVAHTGAWHVRISLNVDQHGNSPVTMFCDVEDTGSYEIPGELISDLLDFGVSGFASLDLTRYTVDSVELEVGCVQLTVDSQVLAQKNLEVAGHIPCDTPSEIDPCPPGKNCCPPGYECDLMIQTCIADE